MTWASLFTRLKDPTIIFAIVLAVCGQIQADSGALLQWIGPKIAGHVLSSVGIIAAVLRILQTLPPKVDENTHDDGTASESGE